MIDEKDPRRESVNADSLDDEIIIDLTDEVVTKLEEDTIALNITEDMAEEASDVSAENARKSPESKVFDSDASLDEDALIIDNLEDDDVDSLDAMELPGATETQQQEDGFEVEEEVELEYERDMEEDEQLNLDLERTEDDPDFVDIVLDTSKTADRDNDDDESTQYLELEPEELDDIILPADDQGNATKDVEPPAESADLVEGDDLPDIEAISELDFENIEDAADSVALNHDELDSSDDIPTNATGQTQDSVDVHDQEIEGETATLELGDIDNFPGLVDPPEIDQDTVSLTEDEHLIFEDELDSQDLPEDFDPDIDDEVIPLDGLGDTPDVPKEEVVEITEFDQHFPVEGETLLKQTGILDPSNAEEDDFLELIDVEEDILSEDEEGVEFSDLPPGNADESINPFLEDESRLNSSDAIISDDLEDPMSEEGHSEPDLKRTLEEEPAIGEEIMERVAELPEIGAERPSISEEFFPETENFDLSFDPGSAARQVDQLDIHSADESANEPDLTAPPADHAAEDDAEETAPDEALLDRISDDSRIVSVGQIDAAIERVINEKFAGKIEDIIYDVIEKAVAKEINRLKGALLGEGAIDGETE